MDIPNIRTVIHFGATSHDRDMYIQRIGMAGRYGKTTIAILLTRKGGKEHIDDEMMAIIVITLPFIPDAITAMTKMCRQCDSWQKFFFIICSLMHCSVSL